MDDIVHKGYRLKNIISLKNSPDVNFCGYTVPHPADTKMHLRIQASKNVRAVDILRRGLADLEKVCDHSITTFENAYEDYQK